MKRRIYFRADAGKEIGYGHFIRTLALADMLKDDFDCVFVTQAPTDYQKAEVAKVCQLVELPTTDEKFSLFLDMLQGDGIVVLDNYFYDTEYQRAVKAKGCKLVCIDDRKGQQYYADIIINHVIGIVPQDIVNLNHGDLLLGPKYALLRKPFIAEMQKNKSHLISDNEILIAMGGTDYNNVTEKIVQFMLHYPDYKINVLIGDKYARKQELEAYPVRIYKNCSADELCELMKHQRLIICPPSTLSYEVCAVRCQLMVGSFVENHIAVEKSLAEYGLAISCGNFEEMTINHFDAVLKEALCDDSLLIKQAVYFDGKQKERFISCFYKQF